MKDSSKNLDIFWDYVTLFVQKIKDEDSPYIVLVSSGSYLTWVEICTSMLNISENLITYQPEYGEEITIMDRSNSEYLNSYTYFLEELEELAYTEVKGAFRFREKKSYSDFLNSVIEEKEFDIEDEDVW